MEITYKNKKIENLCETENIMTLQKLYGKEVAINLPKRIKELKAFESVNDIPIEKPFRRHKLKGSRKNEYAVNVTSNYRLIFISNENNKNIIELKEIKRIRIMEVSKHYE